MKRKNSHLKTFIVETEKSTYRIRATEFVFFSGERYVFRNLVGDDYEDVAEIPASRVLSVIDEGAIPTTVVDVSVISATNNDDGIDFLRDCLTRDTDKTPYSDGDRDRLVAALKSVRQRIKSEFETDATQNEDIDYKLKYLERKLHVLSKLDWKHLLITMIVGISVDLGFGAMIPSTLLSLFSELLKKHFESRDVKKLQDELNYEPIQQVKLTRM